MTQERLVSLIVRHLSGQLEEEEGKELQSWAAEDVANQVLLAKLSDEEELEKELDRFRTIDPAEGYNRWLKETLVQRRKRLQWVGGWAVAASLVAVVVTTGLVRQFHSARLNAAEVAKHKLIMPGRNTAILTLSNGRQVLLDSAAPGNLAQEGNTRLIKPDSTSLSYEATSGAYPTVYNTLTTPRAGQYQLTLSDGSRVWLNNVSSLRFPTAFPGKTRKVELSGEAYFEIAPQAGKPFTVKVGGQSVEVLGTSFNVMAYPDEDGVQTTLLTGAVRVQTAAVAVRLQPGEQARAMMNGNVDVLKNAPIEDIVSWKNGFFYFGRASFVSVMRQLARWYDVDVVYEGKIPNLEFGGKIDRGLTLDELLKYLDKSQVHFRLEGRKLIVL